MRRLVHLFEDEKFVDTTIKQFESVAPGTSRYIVFSDTERLKHPARLNYIEVMPNNYKKLDLQSIFAGTDFLMIHYMTPIKAYLLKHKPPGVVALWSVWGKDAYDHFDAFDQFGPRTAELVSQNWKTRLKKLSGYSLYYRWKYGVKPLGQAREVLAKVNLLSTVLPPEYELICKEFAIQPSYVRFSYDSLGDTLKETLVPELGNGVLLGNSATPPNNHLDVFPFLDKHEGKIIVPLSYGDRAYASQVEQQGFRKFRDQLEPITEFMDFSAYKQKLSSCNTMIMYHIRQQGLGNILLGAMLGHRLFLHPDGAMYRYLDAIGMKVFDPDKDRDLIGTPLEMEDKRSNRDLVREFWGEHRIRQGTENVVKQLNASHAKNGLAAYRVASG